ncbi:hypothetical protein KAU32_02765 [bacterium]|nr:hypothetical protein [bacterium]
MNSDSNLKREILLAHLVKLSPTTIALKDYALERFIMQAIYFEKTSLEREFTINEIQKKVREYFQVHLTIKEVKRLFQSLINCGYIESVDRKNIKLLRKGYDEIDRTNKEHNYKYEKIINKLFDLASHPGKYKDAFFDFLGHFFSRIAGEYVASITGKDGKKDFVTSHHYKTCVNNVIAKYNHLNEKILKKGLSTFISVTDPEYDYIKWTVTQNYYITKVLGLDPNGHALNVDIFKDAEFILDTNIIYNQIFMHSRNHLSFEFFTDSVKSLNVKFTVLEISIKELQRLLDGKMQQFQNIYSDMSSDMQKTIADMSHKIDDEIYLEYLDWKRKNSGNIKKFCERYLDVASLIDYDNKINNSWFNDNKIAKDITRLAEVLQKKYSVLSIREKSSTSALHDSLMLKWVDKVRETGKEKTWVLTLDHSLPGILYSAKDVKSIALSLDTLLQWFSPYMKKSKKGEVEEIFSDMIRKRFLPNEKIFELEDFKIFEKIGVNADKLSEEQIEDFLDDIKFNHGYDIHNPDNISKLRNVFAKLEAKREEELEEQVLELSEKKYILEEKVQSVEEENKNYIDQIDQKDETLKETTSTNKALNEQIEKLKNKLFGIEEDREIDKSEREKEKKRDCKEKFIMWITILVLLYIVLVFLSYLFAGGENIIQKVCNFWPFFVVVTSSWIIIVNFVLGRNCKEQLGFLKRILKKNKD